MTTRLWESVQSKKPKPWPEKWILHHDIATVHDASGVSEFLVKKSITTMDHPLYSPNSALPPMIFGSLQNYKKP
jgi:hypothetical protein